MLFISIPVHENVDAIINQCVNFSTLCKCCIVLHVNARSSNLKPILSQALVTLRLKQSVFINPESKDVKWGDLFEAHISNLKFIRNELSSGGDFVAFNASNDMLIKINLNKYISEYRTLYHVRRYFLENNYYWWPVNKAKNDDVLLQLMKTYFGECQFILGSQIEGSVYQTKFLFQLLDILEKEEKWLKNKSFNYPREEIWFPTFAYMMNEKPSGDPFIFSEINKYDSDVYSIFRFIENLPLPAVAKKLSKKTLSAVLRRLPYYKINRKTIDAIANNKIQPIKVIDHDLQWLSHTNADHIFGVKRIPRKLNNNLRVYISSLNKLDL